MKRCQPISIACLSLLAACSDPGVEQADGIALADNGVPVAAMSPGATRAGASVDRSVPTLQTMAAPDFASARMMGPGCQWRAAADADALFAFDSETGVVKVEGSYVRLLADTSAGRLSAGAFRAYEGGQWRISIEGGDGSPITQAARGAEWNAVMTLAVDGGPSQRFEGGILSCRA